MDTSPIPQSPVPTPKPVKHRQLPLLAAILSLLVLSIIAALAYQNFILKKQIYQTQNLSISPTPKETLACNASCNFSDDPRLCSSELSCINGSQEKNTLEPKCRNSQCPTEKDCTCKDKFIAPSDWKTYTNEKYKFSFQYPPLDSLCCNIAGPLSGNPENLIVLADKSTVMEGTDKPFNGLAIYTVPNNQNQTFQDYLSKQKPELLNNYQEFTGNQPKYSETATTVGKQNGFILKGYAWWSDMIYIPFPDNKNFLVIAKTETSERSFDETFNQILSTFRFLD